jgi:hypothetical protein
MPKKFIIPRSDGFYEPKKAIENCNDYLPCTASGSDLIYIFVSTYLVKQPKKYVFFL